MASASRAVGLIAALLLTAGLCATAAAPLLGIEAVSLGGRLLLGGGALAGAILLFLVSPAWAISLGIAATVFSGNWALLGSPLPLDRLLFAIGVGSVLLRARSVDEVIGGPPRAVHWLMVLAVIYCVGSAFMVGAFEERSALFAILDRFGIVPFILFATAPVVFADSRSRRILLGTLVAVGAYLALIAITSRLGPTSLVYPRYILDPGLGIHADRARGPFLEASANGMALFQCAVAAMVLAWVEADRRVRLLCGAVAALCALGILLTLTRAIWGASAIAVVVALLAARETRRVAIPIVIGGAAATLAAIALIPGLQSDVDSRTDDQRPIWDRENANAAAVAMLAERPLLGFGWFQFEKESEDYMTLAPDRPITRSGLEEHNVFLSNAVELGAVGVGLWAAALVLGIGGALLRRGPPELRPWRIGLVAVAAQWFVVANFVPLGFAFANAMVWLWAGIVLGARRVPEPVAEQEPVRQEAARSRTRRRPRELPTFRLPRPGGALGARG